MNEGGIRRFFSNNGRWGRGLNEGFGGTGLHGGTEYKFWGDLASSGELKIQRGPGVDPKARNKITVVSAFTRPLPFVKVTVFMVASLYKQKLGER